jgi:hypothetical protein
MTPNSATTIQPHMNNDEPTANNLNAGTTPLLTSLEDAHSFAALATTVQHSTNKERHSLPTTTLLATSGQNALITANTSAPEAANMTILATPAGSMGNVAAPVPSPIEPPPSNVAVISVVASATPVSVVSEDGASSMGPQASSSFSNQVAISTKPTEVSTHFLELEIFVGC